MLHGDSTGVPLHLIVRDLPYGAWIMAQFLDLFSDAGSGRAAQPWTRRWCRASWAAGVARIRWRP